MIFKNHSQKDLTVKPTALNMQNEVPYNGDL